MSESSTNKKGAMIAVFLTTKKRASGSAVQEKKIVEKLQLEKTVKELRASSLWKAHVLKMIKELGYEPVTTPSFLTVPVEGCELAMTVLKSEDGLTGRRAKPVTRGGRTIGAPVTGKRTMATVRRQSSR